MHKMCFKFLLIFATGIIYSQTRVASIFGSHMVLQRNVPVQIWGTDAPDTSIEINGSWGKQAKTKTDSKGIWKTTLQTNEAGGPYTLKVKGSTELVFSNVLLGEVWICGGQSNMAMTLDGGPGQHIEDSNDMILNSKNSNLRFFTVAKTISEIPISDCKGQWEISEPKTAVNFSAVGYSFGLQLLKYLNVPIGLISSNVGATPAQAWTPKEVITKEFPEFNQELSGKYDIKTATGLYNGMIHPLIPYTIKGAIWYQGEGNAENPEQYTRLFPAMIDSWRANWGQDVFPFYFVQIAPYTTKHGENWVKLQQAQLKTMLTVPNTGMAVINDIGSQYRIHPQKKKEVGQRLALWALAKNYEVEGIQYSGPTYKSMKIEKDKALLSFNHAPLGLSSLDKTLSDFEIAGNDGVYHSAEAKIIDKGEVLEVWSKEVTNPKAVRYAWKNWVEGSLFNTAGLPASSFSTEVGKKFLNN